MRNGISERDDGQNVLVDLSPRTQLEQVRDQPTDSQSSYWKHSANPSREMFLFFICIQQIQPISAYRARRLPFRLFEKFPTLPCPKQGSSFRPTVFGGNAADITAGLKNMTD